MKLFQMAVESEDEVVAVDDALGAHLQHEVGLGIIRDDADGVGAGDDAYGVE